jgi:hypothetical protein
MFQAPALVFSLILASIYAVVFYLWRGRRSRDLLFFWLASVVGFASGQLAGQVWGFVPWTIGQVHAIEATMTALLFLVLAQWLRQEKGS